MIIFDEKKHAEKMLKKGFMTKKRNVYELHVLSKYYFSLGKNEDEVKENIITFCKKYVEYFNKDEWYKIINKTVSSAQKNKFIVGREVYITENELQHIVQLEKVNEQKVAFVMLVLYKFYGFKKFEISIEDLYKLSKLNLNSKTKLQILQSLTAKELIDITMGSKRWVKFAEKQGDAVIRIVNFDDFIYEYERYIGEKGFSGCEVCDKAIKLTGRNHRRCEVCRDLLRDKQNKEKALRHYHKNKEK